MEFGNTSVSVTRDYFKITLIFIIGNPVIAMGIVTSILTYWMFNVENFTPKSTKRILKCVAVTDTGFLTLAIFYLQFKMYFRDVFPNTGSAAAIKSIYQIRGFYIPASVCIQILELFRNWLTVLIGVERLIVTCYPFRAPTLCTPGRTVWAILGILIFTLILRVPMLIRLITRNQSELAHISRLARTVHDYVDLVFLWMLPVIILITCSVLILKALKRSTEQVDNATNNADHLLAKRKAKVTKMLVVVIVIFSISAVPMLVYMILPSSGPPGSTLASVKTLFISICWLASLTLSCSNFFVYVGCMPRYRVILGRMLRCRRGTPRSGHVSGMPLNDASKCGSELERLRLNSSAYNVTTETCNK